jgi:Tfp pilus assembly protein PilN
MNKIDINLNPQKENAPSEMVRNIAAYVPLLTLGIAVIFIIIVLLQVFAFQKQHSYNVYKGKWAQWEDEDTLLKRLKNNIYRLEEEKEGIAAIITPKNEAAKLLSDIYAVLPKNIWFDELKFREGFLSLNGYVVRWEEDYLVSLDKFINGLRNGEAFSSHFQKVNIKQSQKDKIRGVEVLRFSLECLN